MNTSEESIEEHEDRLSELPDSLIFEIFWWLPMRDVVRTTILSKWWNNLWTTTPYLNFDDYDSKFINRALILWRRFRILKLKIVVSRFKYSDMQLWVRLAQENGVQELYLENNFLCEEWSKWEHYWYPVPHNLYSCSSLKVLSLRGCKLPQIYGNVQWNQLWSLTIEICVVDDADLINQVVSGSPRLEVLILDLLYIDNKFNLSILSSSLKKLSIKKESHSSASSSTYLRISSPNLETLDIIGKPYDKYSLTNVSSLIHLTLDLYQYSCWNNDVLGEELGQIFPTIQHVEKLTISDWCIKVLGAMKEKFLSNLNFLEINISSEYEGIVDLLQIFPQLKTLVLHSTCYSWWPPLSYATSFVQVERNLPESFLQQLRTVVITWKGDYVIFPIAEFLLKHASKLQKMVIRGPTTPETREWIFSDYY